MTLYKRALFKRIKDKYAPDEVDKLALLIIVVFLTIFSVMGCIEAYASEIENVDVTLYSNLNVSPNRNYFITLDEYNVGYFQVESGYIYHITKNGGASSGVVVGSSDTPAPNVTYNIIASVDVGDSYDYIATSNSYLFISFPQNASNDTFSVTREKLANFDGAVNDLVDNVGINQIWNVFNDGVSFVGVVVLVAFGIFLIVLAIRKVSKGKSEF